MVSCGMNGSNGTIYKYLKVSVVVARIEKIFKNKLQVSVFQAFFNLHYMTNSKILKYSSYIRE